MTSPTPALLRRAPRLSGWRGWIARVVALLLALNFVLPHAGMAAQHTASDLLVICTAEGVMHVPAADVGGGAGKSTSHAGDEHCPACRLAAGAPILPPPDFVLRTPQSIVETIALLGAHEATPQPAHPPGSRLSRAPPIPV
jgi:hypothetical protein